MKPFRLLTYLCAVVILVVALTFTAAFAVDWNHDPKSAIGPNFWGSLSPDFATCGSVSVDPVTGAPGPFVEVGKAQTPVNIIVADTIPTVLPDLVFEYEPTPFKVKNTGHVVEVEYEQGSFLGVGQDSYELQQFHLHAPSEHTINGKSAAAELHLVHKNGLGNLAVVGIMIQLSQGVTTPLNAVINEILLSAPLNCLEAVPPVPPCDVAVGGEINALYVLPLLRSYYNYSGSLTTPPCSEGVRWFVLKDPVFVSARAIERFHSIIGQFPTYRPPINFRVWNDDNRPVRPLNGREIWNQIP